jgi:site-specific recombinase XerD
VKTNRWDGGHIHVQADGKKLYVIEKRRGGHKFHISTRCHSETAAYEHWRRFQSDPWKYAAEMKLGRVEDVAVLLTDDLADEFTAWQIEKKGVTRKHAKETGHRLADWLDELKGVDLRTATLRDHIKPALARMKTMRAHRIATIKVFYAWLREEKHLLRTAEDPTLDLPVPQAVPEKRKRRKAVDIAVLKAVLPHLGPNHRDILMVLAHTGMHFTELERLVRDEASEISRASSGTTIGVLSFLHKSRDRVTHAVTDMAVLEAAERLRKTGIAREIPPCAPSGEKPMRPNRALKFACEKAKVPVFKLGVLRHSVGTDMHKRGATKGQIRDFLHHKDDRTTDLFYLDVEIPTVAIRPPSLTGAGEQ